MQKLISFITSALEGEEGEGENLRLSMTLNYIKEVSQARRLTTLIVMINEATITLFCFCDKGRVSRLHRLSLV